MNVTCCIGSISRRGFGQHLEVQNAVASWKFFCGDGDLPSGSAAGWSAYVQRTPKVLPTCYLRFMPYPTDEEFKAGVVPSLPFLSYYFEKIPVLGRRYDQFTPYFIKGDRMYSGVIQTPTRSIEVIKFERDPDSPTLYIPKRTVVELPEKVLENECKRRNLVTAALAAVGATGYGKNVSWP